MRAENLITPLIVINSRLGKDRSVEFIKLKNVAIAQRMVEYQKYESILLLGDKCGRRTQSSINLIIYNTYNTALTESTQNYASY